MCMGLLLLQTTSAVEPKDDKNNTVCIDNETESVSVSCGNVPETATAIKWFIKTFNGWKRIMRASHNETGEFQKSYFKGHNEDKYDISEFQYTHLVVRNINLSDNNYFKCSTTGTSLYTYTTLLKVVGKYHLVSYLFRSD